MQTNPSKLRTCILWYQQISNDGVRRRAIQSSRSRTGAFKAELFVELEHVSVGIVYGSIGDTLLDEALAQTQSIDGVV